MKKRDRQVRSSRRSGSGPTVQSSNPMPVIRLPLPEVRRRIIAAGLEITVEQRLPDHCGTQLMTLLGHVVTVYDTHRAVIGGQHQMQMFQILTAQRPR
jgi:hypothetical protein